LNEFSISLIQIGPDAANPSERLRELADAIPPGTDAILLPESWAGSSPEESVPCLESLSGVCADRCSFAVSGGMPWDDGGRNVMRTWMLDDMGKNFAYYDKAHLSSKKGEDKKYSPGKGARIFNIGEAVCAAISGYDMLFPEFCRQISLAGVQVFFVSANRDEEFAHIWEPLLQSVAFTNQCFIAACSGAGDSAVISPRGEIMPVMERGEGVTAVSIKLYEAANCRKNIPLERDRRGEIYALFP
jgi:predicted amidohydrolase